MLLRSTTLGKVAGLVAAAALSAAFLASGADARPGGGKSVGSRGEKTHTAPPTTNTAPKQAGPMEKTMTPPGKPGAATAGQTAGAATAAAPSRFGMMGGLLMGGLIGAGLASMFGMGGMANVLGFVLQALVIGGIVYLLISLFRRRSAQPAMATATVAAPARPDANQYRQAASAVGGSIPPLTIKPDDFSAFERLLGEVQLAYGRNDIKALETRTTPEMLSYFAGELSENARKGVRNEVSAPKLLQGDLSEAWREAGGEYASVAMRYALLDATVETASGRVVEGSRTTPTEATEVWTFWRPHNGNPGQWELSGIQQA